MRLAIVTIVVLWTGFAHALDPGEALNDPVLETRARSLSQELRCIVCQNQSIDDSDAGLARDLRTVVRTRLVAGDTDAQVLDHIAARYGEFALLRPRVSGATILLWLTPILLVAAFSIGLVRRFRNVRIEAEPLTEAERKRLREVLASSPSGTHDQVATDRQ